MKTKLILLITLVAYLVTACEYDNYDEPDARLTGKVVYNGNPVGVRIDGARLELWQDGYENRSKIDVFIGQDGTYSAALFDGEYKLVRTAGAPWLEGDTVLIDVKGTTIRDIEVTPYFVIEGERIQQVSGEVQATFTVRKVTENSNLQDVCLLFGKNLLIDRNINAGVAGADISAITPGVETTLTAAIPDNLANEEYLFIRLAVLSDKSSEYFYTQTQKIQLK